MSGEHDNSPLDLSEMQQTVFMPVENPADLEFMIKRAIDKRMLIETLVGENFKNITNLFDLISALKEAIRGPIGEKLIENDKKIRQFIVVDGIARVELVSRKIHKEPDKIPVNEIDAVTDESGLRDLVWSCVLEKMKPLDEQKLKGLLAQQSLFRGLREKWEPFKEKNPQEIANILLLAEETMSKDKNEELADWIRGNRLAVLTVNLKIAQDRDANMGYVTRDSGLRDRMTELQKPSGEKKEDKIRQANALAERHKMFFAAHIGETKPFERQKIAGIVEKLNKLENALLKGKTGRNWATDICIIESKQKKGEKVSEGLKGLVNLLPEDSGLRQAVLDACGRKAGAEKRRVGVDAKSEPTKPAEAKKPEKTTKVEKARVLKTAPKSRPLDLSTKKIAGGFSFNKPLDMQIFDRSHAMKKVLEEASTIREITTALESLLKRGSDEIAFNDEDVFNTQEVIDYLKAVDGGKIDLKKMPIESRELASVLESITMEQSLKKGFLGRIGDFLRGKK
ncbi:hypothetical protein KKC87_03090 [Patescibacteria group bacterium]|nr:hypothetical protein [Patescibacteria group bacterium]